MFTGAMQSAGVDQPDAAGSVIMADVGVAAEQVVRPVGQEVPFLRG